MFFYQNGQPVIPQVMIPALQQQELSLLASQADKNTTNGDTTATQVSALTSKRNNNQIRKRVTSDMQVLSIAQAKNNALNTTEDSLSPHRAPGVISHSKGQIHIIEQSLLRPTSLPEEIMKLMKVQTGISRGNMGQTQKNRARPQYGLVDSNFTGLY